MALHIDLLAGQAHAAVMTARAPRLLVFDSGLGGLTVLSEVMRLRPDADIAYLADDAAFPYGAWAESALVERIVSVIGEALARHQPDAVVIACNTASTLALPALRARFSLPFVGTVPAIKPAAALSHSKMISVLATPGTVARDYTRSLIAEFAADCAVTLVGSARLAACAEAELHGDPASDAVILSEIAPAFVQHADGRRTDVITLSCTHYPLLLPRLEALAPWPVRWIDPAPAIARRVASLLSPACGDAMGEAQAHFTSGHIAPPVAALLAGFGLDVAPAA